MYWGLCSVGAVAFSCATEFIPEVNEKLKLVPFDGPFKVRMTAIMIVDYVGCWIIENGLKRAFSDFRPKDIATRREDQLKREEERNQRERGEEIREALRKQEEADLVKAEEVRKAR